MMAAYFGTVAFFPSRLQLLLSEAELPLSDVFASDFYSHGKQASALELT